MRNPTVRVIKENMHVNIDQEPLNTELLEIP